MTPNAALPSFCLFAVLLNIFASSSIYIWFKAFDAFYLKLLKYTPEKQRLLCTYHSIVSLIFKYVTIHRGNETALKGAT